MHWVPLLACLPLLVPASSRADDPPARHDPIEEIELIPPAASWGIRNVAIGVAALFGGWGHWYGENQVHIETVPSDASIALYYIRANFQKRYEVARSPVRVSLPPRVDMTAKDTVMVRASMPGFLSREQKFLAAEVPDELLLTLDPLPNRLTFLGLTSLGGRTTLALRSSEKPELRLGKSRSFSGFTLSITQTADGLGGPPSASGGLVEGIEVAQVGEDLLLRIETSTRDVEARSKGSFDPIRESHSVIIDLVRRGERSRSPDSIRTEFERLAYRLDSGCDLRFEVALRERIDSQQIARAFRPSGGIADVYRSESMKRLGRLDRGRVTMLSGERLRTGSDLELALALQTPAAVEGYFGLLGAFARTQDDPATTLRSLVAPDLGPDEFAPIWKAAEDARIECAP